MIERKAALKAGIGAAVFGMLCCIGPLIPILLGIGGAGALFGLHRYQPLFVVIGLVILASASWITVRRHNHCCTVPSRKKNAGIVVTIFGVGILFYLLLQFAVVPVLSCIASRNIQPAHATSDTLPAGLTTIRLDISGMNCAGCAVGIEQALLTVPGVREAHVDWQTGTGEVRFDPEQVHPTAILQAPVQEQYTLTLKSGPELKPNPGGEN